MERDLLVSTVPTFVDCNLIFEFQGQKLVLSLITRSPIVIYHKVVNNYFVNEVSIATHRSSADRAASWTGPLVVPPVLQHALRTKSVSTIGLNGMFHS